MFFFSTLLNLFWQFNVKIENYVLSFNFYSKTLIYTVFKLIITLLLFEYLSSLFHNSPDPILTYV